MTNLREDVNRHLLAADVVGEVFGGHRKCIASCGQMCGDQKFGRYWTRGLTPAEFTGETPYIRATTVREVSDDRPKTCTDSPRRNRVLSSLDPDRGRFARNHECLRFAKNAALTIAQDQANCVRPIGHVGRSQKSGLPDVFVLEKSKRLHQPEREHRDN